MAAKIQEWGNSPGLRLARREERKRLSGEVDWLKRFPIGQMIKVGWIKKHKDKADQVDEVLKFFGVASPKQWESLWLSPSAAYRKSTAFSAKPEASSAWLRKGELQAQEVACKPYDKVKFMAALEEILGLTRTEPEKFESKSVQMCAEAGIAVVFIPPMKGAPVYGATRWLTAEKALIQLSLRGRFEDMLWFTFSHEAGHILFHGKKAIFIEGDDNETEERAADRFAANFLIPNSSWKEFVSSQEFRKEAAVKSFATKLEICPAIIVGRLQHEGFIPHSHLNALRRRFVIDTN